MVLKITISYKEALKEWENAGWNYSKSLTNINEVKKYLKNRDSKKFKAFYSIGLDLLNGFTEK